MQVINLNRMTAMAISTDEREFFIALGNHIAELRKAKGITQIQMAQILAVSQQTINSYEVGRRRVPASALPAIARMLTISIDELLGEPATTTKNKRGPTPKLQQTIDKIGSMPRSKQKFIAEMLDAIVAQQQAS